jgi:hypothetical protein
MSTATVNAFQQVVVWPGTVVGTDKIEEFESFMKDQIDTRVKYIEEIKTGPDMEDGCPVEGTGGRNDLLFYVHSEDLMSFAIARLQFGMRWIEDVLDNESEDYSIYPERVKEYRKW